MAYARSYGRRAPARGRSRSVRAPARRSTRRAPVRRTARRSGGFSRGGELRIVIEQPGASSVSRYPGVAAKLSPAPRKAKY